MFNDKSILQYLRFVTAGGRVKRYHTFPTLNIQTDAEHSHGVCMLLFALAEGRPSAALLMSGLVHDLAEHKYSDVSAHTKNSVEGLSALLHKLEGAALGREGLDFLLTPQEQHWLEMADKLEGMLFAVHERNMGNRYTRLVYSRFRNTLPACENPAEFRVVTTVEALWHEAETKSETADYIIPYGGE